ncbi:glycosyltransferase family 2 protein, partial [Neosynechococcus sphagnicola]|uniref:glycosyltransferase family 2 protein n=1 Tax=Neosynechococcus sphagnicola TaxID=1501145 RepID=UPI001EF9D22E
LEKFAAFKTQQSVPAIAPSQAYTCLHYYLPEIPLSQDFLYYSWLIRNYPRLTDLERMRSTLPALRSPIISILMPVYNTPENYLRAAINSVLAQVYPCWELCIADDASTVPHIHQILKDYGEQDPRIKVDFRTENGNISRCSNSALTLATGEFVALLDHDDLLTPDALYEVVLLINQHPEVDFVYSDEDKIDDHYHLSQPYFKADWCPDSILSRMYTCHLGVYRKSLVEEIGGFREGFEGSQDYDLVLRLTEKNPAYFPHSQSSLPLADSWSLDGKQPRQ